MKTLSRIDPASSEVSSATFAVVLFAGVLLSGLAHRTVLSTAVLFLLAGLVLGTDRTRKVVDAMQDHGGETDSLPAENDRR